MRNRSLRWLALIAIAMIIPLLSGCFTILSVTQVATTPAGTQFTVEIEVRTEDTDENAHYGIVGVLLPLDFTVDSVYFSGDFGPDYCVFLHPDSADSDPGGQVDFWAPALEAQWPSPLGYEWRVYQSTAPYASALDTGYIDLVVDMTAGQFNGNYNLSYFVCNAALDMTDSSYYDISRINPIQVTGGIDLVNVTFRANTATVPDTLGSVVQVRGSAAPLTWGGDSPVILTHVGGDYWEGTFPFLPGSNVQYKFYTNARDMVAAGDPWEHQGWEGNVNTGSTNREFVVGLADMVLPLQFVNGWKQNADPLDTPYTTNDSTFVVWIRTNMQGYSDFDPARHVVGIRGSNTADWGQTGELSWGTTYLLTQEANHVNAGSQQYNGANFYSGAVHVPNIYAGTGIKFKAVVHNIGAPLDEDWGVMVHNSAREDEIPISGNDTTFHWFWFDNFVPVTRDNQDSVVVTWNADMANAIATNGFAPGDTVEVRWGYYGTAVEEGSMVMQRQGFSTVWSATDTIVTTIGENLDYQYYKIKGGQEYREIFYNFDYAGDIAGEQERRMVEAVGGAVITVDDLDDSRTSIHRMPVFRNTAVLAQDVLVTFTCDVRPAFYQVAAGDTLEDIQGDLDVTVPDSVIAWGLAMNGPATGAWTNDIGPDWGLHLLTLENKVMYDDGTHGDAAAGDSVFTKQIQFYTDSADVVGQEFKFGIGGGDNEGGKGGYGNNHIENIDDTGPTFIIASQFGSINPSFYDAWDYDAQSPSTGVEDGRALVPLVYRLEKNYPNPFNPVTHIRYQIPKTGKVVLSVYNILGKKVVSLVDKQQPAGSHLVTWDGRDSDGRMVGSGVYFYRIESGDFSKTYKMIFMK